MKRTAFKKPTKHKCARKGCKVKIELNLNFCSDECRVLAYGQAMDAVERNRKKWLKKQQAEVKKEKIEKRPHGVWENLLQDEINTIARLIDYGHGCMSCTSLGNGKTAFHGGHRISVGANNSLRYNLEIIWKQDFYCNNANSGNPDGYDDSIRAMYGQEQVDRMTMDLQRLYPIIKLTIDDIQTAIKICRKIIKELKADPKMRTAEERLRLRKELNLRIGIYTLL